MSGFRTSGKTPEEHTQLAFAIMSAQDDLAEAGIEHPKLGAIQEVLATNGIETTIIDGADGVPVIYRKGQE